MRANVRERASEQAKERTNEYKSKRQTLQHFNTYVDISRHVSKNQRNKICLRYILCVH